MKYICGLEEIRDTKCVHIDQQHYYLVRDGGNVRMFSLICPHMGGIVEPQGELLVCPIHKWKFDASTGQSIVGSKDLREIRVVVEDDKIMADIADSPELQGGKAVKADLSMQATPPDIDVDIKLLSHACLEIKHSGFTLITDPWLDGPAFHGSWIQYPAPSARPEEIKPDALLITHEHSDHCHPNTLAQLDKSIPVYFPAFPNKRLDKILSDLGFKNLYPMIFGQPYRLNDDFTITCFDPTGNWNDSIHLIDIQGYRLLNLNDAGVNFRIAQLVQPVDLICSSYGSGASAFPMCWTHFSREEAEKLLQDQIKAKQDMLVHASKIYQCSRILLFASYFALYHPEHQQYQEMLTKYKIKPHEIRQRLSEQNIDVLDILPGESWSSQTSEIERKGYGKDTFSWETVLSGLQEAYNAEEFRQYYPSGYSYDEKQVVDYFLKFKLVPEIRHVKNYTFKINAIGQEAEYPLTFQIKDRSIQPVPNDAECNLTLDVPLQLLMHLIKYNLSWDEVYIGYWCRFHNENPYNVAFWRLLQAPYYLKSDASVDPGSPSETGGIGASVPIGTVLESYGDIAARIMSRHGMYCVGCERSPMETLDAGAKKHGLTTQELTDLIDELNQAIHKEQPAGIL